MQRTRWLYKAVATATLILAISAPEVRAEDETPYEPPSARIGRPPGDSSTASDPEPKPSGTSATNDPAATPPPEARMSRSPGEPSIWEAFISWLQEQALLIANR